MPTLESGAVIIGCMALAAGAALGARSTDAPLEAALIRMDAAAKTLRGLSADVRKVSHTAVLNEDSIDEGSIRFKRPKPHDMRMLVDIKKPDVKTVSVQGRKVEIYYPKMNTVQVYDAGENRHLMEQFLQLGFGSTSAELRSSYTLSGGGAETIAGQPAYRLELIPKSKDMLAHLKKVELWISSSSGLTVQQKFYLPGGDYTLATYTSLKLIPNMPDSVLKLNLPKGVKRETPQK